MNFSWILFGLIVTVHVAYSRVLREEVPPAALTTNSSIVPEKPDSLPVVLEPSGPAPAPEPEPIVAATKPEEAPLIVPPSIVIVTAADKPIGEVEVENPGAVKPGTKPVSPITPLAPQHEKEDSDSSSDESDEN